MLIKGNTLWIKDKEHVLSAYIHRFTKDHKPMWARETMPNGNKYPVQFESDSDWLDNTFFEVTKQGRLDKRFHHCESNPTWPDNPELR